MYGDRGDSRGQQQQVDAYITYIYMCVCVCTVRGPCVSRFVPERRQRFAPPFYALFSGALRVGFHLTPARSS